VGDWGNRKGELTLGHQAGSEREKIQGMGGNKRNVGRKGPAKEKLVKKRSF